MAAITLQVEIGPETRELLERLAGKVILQVELGPRTRALIQDLVSTRESGGPAAGVRRAR